MKGRTSLSRGPGRAWLAGLALACHLASPLALAQSPLSPAEAKRHFDVAETLYAQGQYEPALLEYLTSYKLGRKRSALINAADCQRKLNRFADAYESYARVLAEHGDKLKPNEKQLVGQALKELAQLTGEIEIESSEPGAEVTIDDAKVGVTPLPARKRVTIAKHKVRVTKAGFDPFEVEVDVVSQSVNKVAAVLKPESAAGRLSVREQGGKAVHVIVDGTDMGPAPWEGEVAPGVHAVELSGEWRAAEKRITIQKKERIELTMTAEKALGHLRVTTSQAWVQILVDRRIVGYGAWEGDVAPGVHEVEVVAGYARESRRVTVKGGESINQEIPVVPVAPEGEVREPSYRGAYGGFTIGFAFWLTPPRYTPGQTIFTTSYSTPQAVPLTIRAGYSFNVFAVEFVGTLTLTHALETVALGTAGTTLEAYGISGFFGVGGRVSSKTDPVRVTAGFAPGLVVRAMSYTVGANTFNAAPWVSPGLHGDVGIMFGHSPGGKFFLGAEMWADFPGNVTFGPDTANPVAVPDPTSFTLAKSPEEIFIGPTLGGQWGH